MAPDDLPTVSARPAARSKRRAAPRPPAASATPPATAALAIGDLKHDLKNRRQRTTRGAKMLRASLALVGAARSIVIDEDNEILAGNGVVEAAADAGITKVHVIDTDGQTLIAVRRRNLTPEDKRALAIYDNRTGELSQWDAEQLLDDRLNKLPLRPFFEEAELKKHLREPARAEETGVQELDTSAVHDQFWIAVRGPLPSQAAALDRLKQVMTEIEGVVVELGVVRDAAPADPAMEW